MKLTPVNSLLDQVRSFDREEFCRVYSHPFILLNQENADRLGPIGKSEEKDLKDGATLRMKTPDYEFLPQSLDELLMLPLSNEIGGTVVKQFLIGRKNECNLSVPDRLISSKHLTLQFDGEEDWTVEEAGSTNGTELNGMWLLPLKPKKLEDGDRLTLAGAYNFIFFSSGGLYEFLKQSYEEDSI